jgi:uncharacterized membrane protein YcaP (DUF421 family)
LKSLNWEELFSINVPVQEVILRGTVIYLSLFLLLRVILKRQAGTVGITDLLVVVLIADASQNAMAGGQSSITDGILLVATIATWSYALDWLGYRFPWIERFVHPPALPLVKNGKMLRRNMRQELVTEDELLTQVRRHGLEEIGQVKLAYMEGDGTISVIGGSEGSSEGKRVS